MKKVIQTFIFTLFCLPLAAQEVVDWQKTLGTSGGDDCQTSCLTSDGGIVLGGTQSVGGSTDYYVIKLDGSGNVDWQATYGGSSSDVLTSIEQTSDGGYVLGGQSNSNASGDKSENSRGSYDYWIVKLDAGGTVEWNKTFGGSDLEFQKVVVHELNTGNYIVAGSSRSNSSGEKTANSVGLTDYWILEYEAPTLSFPMGQVLWDKTIGSTGQDILSDLIISQGTLSNSFIMTGISAGNISGDKTGNSYGSYDYWIVKTDNSGTVTWDRTAGGSGNESASVLLEDQYGDIVVAGSSASPAPSGNKTAATNGSTDFWVVKLNSSGTYSTDVSLGGTSSEFPFNIQEILGTGYLIGGVSSSGVGTIKTQANRGAADFWAVDLDYSFSQLDDRTFGGSNGENNTHAWRTSSGDYYLTGSSLSNTSGDKSDNSLGSMDFWCIKTTAYSNPVVSFVDVCAGMDPVQLNGGNANGAYTYSWTSVPSGYSSSLKNPTASPLVNTVYNLAITNASGENVASHSINVTVRNCCDNNTISFSKYHVGIADDFYLDPVFRTEAGITSANDIISPGAVDVLTGAPVDYNAYLGKVKENANHDFGYDYDFGTGFSASTNAKEMSNGDYVMVGKTSSVGSGNTILFVQSVNPTHGTVNWTTYLDQTVHDVSTANVTELINGELAVVGFVNDGTNNHVLVTILDQAGTVIGSGYTAYPLINRQDPMIFDVTATSDGGFIMAGSSGYDIINHDYRGALLVKFDAAYALEWIKDYQYACVNFGSTGCDITSSDPNDRGTATAFAVVEDQSNSRYVVAGFISDENLSGGLISITKKTALVFEVDLNGGFIQAYDMGYPSMTAFFNITTAGSDFLLTGYRGIPGGSYAEHPVLCRMDNNITHVWSYNYGPFSPVYRSLNRAYSAFELPSGDIRLHGMVAAGGLTEQLFIKTDANGENGCEISLSPGINVLNMIERDQYLDSPIGATEHSVQFNETINCNSGVTTYCSFQSLLMPVDPGFGAAEQEQSVTLNNTDQNATRIENPEGLTRSTVYPNPSTGHFNLKTDPSTVINTLVIYDYTGKKVKTESGSDLKEFDMSSLSDGIYFLTLYSGDQYLETLRIQLQH